MKSQNQSPITTTDLYSDFRSQLSAALLAAMKARRQPEIRTLRSLLSALDNATAVARTDTGLANCQPVEVPRRLLGHADILALLEEQRALRLRAIAEFERLGLQDHLRDTRAEIEVMEKAFALL